MSLSQSGHESLTAFVQTIQAVVLNNEPFDFIVAASDSGQITAHITGEVYKGIGRAVPAKLIMPIYRHIDKERTLLFDNTVMAPQLANWRDMPLGNVLLVDDEIWRGATLNGILDVLLRINSKPQKLTIVAEDGGFRCPEAIRGIPTTFIATKKRIPDVYNLISFTVPDELVELIKDAVQDEDTAPNHKQIMCTLLGLPIKDRLDGMPVFTKRLIQKSEERIPGFTAVQCEYQKGLGSSVRNYLMGLR